MTPTPETKVESAPVEPVETCLKQSELAQAIQGASVGDLLLALITANKAEPTVRRLRVQFFCKVSLWWRPCSEWVDAASEQEAITKAIESVQPGVSVAGPFIVDSEDEPTPTLI